MAHDSTIHIASCDKTRSSNNRKCSISLNTDQEDRSDGDRYCRNLIDYRTVSAANTHNYRMSIRVFSFMLCLVPTEFMATAHPSHSNCTIPNGRPAAAGIPYGSNPLSKLVMEDGSGNFTACAINLSHTAHVTMTQGDIVVIQAYHSLTYPN